MKINRNYLQQLRTINELAQRIDALPDSLIYSGVAILTVITFLASIERLVKREGNGFI